MVGEGDAAFVGDAGPALAVFAVAVVLRGVFCAPVLDASRACALDTTAASALRHGRGRAVGTNRWKDWMCVAWRVSVSERCHVRRGR